MAHEQQCQLRSAQHCSKHAGSSQFPGRPRRINFLHPGYKKPQNILFHMLALDTPAGGLHHATAQITCAIIAGNRWDGFLSKTATGSAIEAEEDDLLRDAEYYFIVPGIACYFPLPIPPGKMYSADAIESSEPTAASQDVSSLTNSSATAGSSNVNIPYVYPVVPDFKRWMFPHHNLPDIWQEVELQGSSAARSGSDAVALRDMSCRMTAYVEGCDNSHLCPLAEAQWYQDNRMDQYGALNMGGRQGINDPSNIMLLRTDLHRGWDRMRFVHTPKRNTSGAPEFVTHVLAPSKELVDLYHNARLHPLGAARECMFARFAWAMFPLLSGFLQQGHERYLLRMENGTSGLADADACYEYGDSWKPANQRTSRTPSPTKKAKRSGQDAGMINNSGEEDDYGTTTKRVRVALEEHTCITHPDATTPTGPESTSDQELPDLTTSQSASSGGNDPTLSGPSSSWDKRRGARKAIYESALAAERARSDSHGQWIKHIEKEQQWLDDILEHGGAVDASDMKRLARAWGQGIAEDEQRTCCIGKLECRCGLET
ncbi:MAG: hypothetical protein Q9170_007277 [Blastenia crenularia]